jgi:hypothetical protein
MQEYIHQLKRLRSIAPDRAFLVRSKNNILASQKRAVFGLPKFKIPVWAFAGLTAVAIFTLGVSLSLSLFSPKPALSALDSEKLNSEFENLGINIQLREIGYNQSVEQTINSAISEIGNTGTRHLNGSLIEQEEKNIESGFNENSDIDKLLETLIQ